MRTFELRVYTLRNRAYPRQLHNFGLFAVQAHGYGQKKTM